MLCRPVTARRLDFNLILMPENCAGMWERSMDEMLAKLLFKNEESGYTYVAEFAR